jgi:hypothetical protein
MKEQMDPSKFKIDIPFWSDRAPWKEGSSDKTFGITAREACIEQVYRYYWKPGGREAVEEFERRWALLFSGPVWASGSVCVGIALNPYDTFGYHRVGDRLLWEWSDEEISVETVKAYFGDRVDWIGPEVAENPYYLFREDFGIWKLFTNSDGSRIRTDMPILVQQEEVECNLNNLPPWEDVNGNSETWREYRNPTSARTGEHWDPINKYIGMLGKAPDALLDDYTITEDIYYGEVYVDNKTGALFSFDLANECSGIRVPAGILFPELLEGDKDGLRFLEEMGLSAKWGESGTTLRTGFDYGFDDGHRIYFFTDSGDMRLTKNDLVLIV